MPPFTLSFCADCVLCLEAEQDAGPRTTTHSEKCHRVKRVLKTGSVDTKSGKVTLLWFHLKWRTDIKSCKKELPLRSWVGSSDVVTSLSLCKDKYNCLNTTTVCLCHIITNCVLLILKYPTVCVWVCVRESPFPVVWTLGFCETHKHTGMSTCTHREHMDEFTWALNQQCVFP